MEGDWVVNVHHSAKWSAAAKPSSVLPSLTVAHGRGPWLGSRGRRLTWQEACRLQGVCPRWLTWPRRQALVWKMLGNTMSGNVVAEVVEQLLSVISPGTSAADRWTTSAHAATLLADAIGAASGPPPRTYG